MLPRGLIMALLPECGATGEARERICHRRQTGFR